MGSRIRENPAHVFECYCEVVVPPDCSKVAYIKEKFPENYKNEEILKSVPQFACPCEFTLPAVQLFSFVLTNSDSKWTFGYCRHAPSSPTCNVILSYLPWHEIFYKILNNGAELTNNKESGGIRPFLEALYEAKVPEPGLELSVSYSHGTNFFTACCPDHHKLPRIPENRNLTEYFNAVDAYNMIEIFASMLNERRILITSKKLSRLSACVQAANALIFPMHWQHIFIPVLPYHLLEYLSAPMPFLIGVPEATLARVKRSELGDVVLLDADQNRVESSFHDVETLPTEIFSFLKRKLKNNAELLGDGVSRAFLQALVQLIGGYWDALKLKPDGIVFCPESFIQTRPPAMQPFLSKMLNLQIFQQFIECRVRMLNDGKFVSDEFEFELPSYEGKSSSRWMSKVVNMRRGGGALLKNFKSKVKDKSVQAYKDIASRFQDVQHSKLTQDDSAIRPTRRRMGSVPSISVLKQRHPDNYSGISNGNNAISYRREKNALSHNHSHHSPVRECNSESVDGTMDDLMFNYKLQPLSMDLMGDLQDLIFRRLSVEGDSPHSPNASSESKILNFVPEQPDLVSPASKSISSSSYSEGKKEKQTDNPPAVLPRPILRTRPRTAAVNCRPSHISESENRCIKSKDSSLINLNSDTNHSQRRISRLLPVPEVVQHSDSNLLIDLSSSECPSSPSVSTSPSSVCNPIYFDFSQLPPASPHKKSMESSNHHSLHNIGTSTNPFRTSHAKDALGSASSNLQLWNIPLKSSDSQKILSSNLPKTHGVNVTQHQSHTVSRTFSSPVTNQSLSSNTFSFSSNAQEKNPFISTIDRNESDFKHKLRRGAETWQSFQ